MNNPDISIIVPVYKAESSLDKCINSILIQSFRNFELLLIDDGSPDKSGKICDEYAKNDYRIKVFHKENGGVSSARNVGLDNAKGAWITFIDADDYLEGEFLNSLENSRNYDLIISGYEREYDGENQKTFVDIEGCAHSRTEVINYLNDNIRDEIFRTPWGKFFKVEIIRKYHIRFDSRIRFGEDTIFNFTYFQYINSVICVTQGRYVYKIFPNYSASSKYKCDALMITTLRDELFKIYFGIGFSNIRFERFFLSLFTMIEEYYLYHNDDYIRKSYYWNDYQLHLEKNALHTFHLIDRLVYKICKYCTHWLYRPLMILYIKYRL